MTDIDTPTEQKQPAESGTGVASQQAAGSIDNSVGLHEPLT